MINRLTTTLSALDSLPLHPPFLREMSCLHLQYRHFEKSKESHQRDPTDFRNDKEGPLHNGAKPDKIYNKKEHEMLRRIIGIL